ncbi:MAG: Ppx/GppA phosphatase family protein [Alphaproteobacteria bacterium]|nr:Ppx/GppA phosphatase family protein [Alphaproteobacteria bacterium]
MDLGSNNCRLLVARPVDQGFRVVDAFSRIVRLGEGVDGSQRLSAEAMDRTIAALKICAEKMRRRRVTRARCVATAACRKADNCDEFLSRVEQEAGLHLETISAEEEANLAIAGCRPLMERETRFVLVFDIGGGSTELIWAEHDPAAGIKPVAVTSLPHGVVGIAEDHGSGDFDPEQYEALVRRLTGDFRAFEAAHGINAEIRHGGVQMIGTSGTVTTLSGVHLGLAKYDRAQVDGLWLSFADACTAAEQLRGMNLEQRAAHPCIGRGRADLVVAGCAILEAIRRTWPCERLRVADRGVREGLLLSLMRWDRQQAARGRPGAAAP